MENATETSIYEFLYLGAICEGCFCRGCILYVNMEDRLENILLWGKVQRREENGLFSSNCEKK